jgi:hypothetical protein
VLNARINLVPAASMPMTSAFGDKVDSGAFRRRWTARSLLPISS